MKRILTVLALGASIVLAATSCKKDNQPETPRIAPQIWITAEPMEEGGRDVYFALKLDGDGKIGFGYVADEQLVQMLHLAAENAKGELKEQFAAAKTGDLALIMGKYDLKENEDKVSGEFNFVTADGKSKARIEYSKLTLDSVSLVFFSTPAEGEEKVTYNCEFKTPAALGMEVGNTIDITSLS